MFLPGNKHGPRLAKPIQDVYNEVAGADAPIPTGRTYLCL